jgi:hypothetical protein
VTVLIFDTRWQNEHPYSLWLTLLSLKFVWMMYKCNDTTNNIHWTCMIEICFIFIQHVAYCVATVAHCWFVHRKKCNLQNMYKFLSHVTLCITLAKTNLNNADINELYLVQISGLWGSSQLLHNHWSSSYIKTMFSARDTAANWNTRQLLLHSVTHTLPKW